MSDQDGDSGSVTSTRCDHTDNLHGAHHETGYLLLRMPGRRNRESYVMEGTKALLAI